MANNYSLVPTIRFNTIDTNLAVVDGVVDAIRATDVVNIRADIAALSLISAKEKSLLGIGAFPGFRSYFNRVADGAVPDATFWTLVLNGGGLVTVQNDLANKPGYLYCASGPGAGDDAIAVTKDKVVFSLKAPVTTIHMAGRAKFDFTADAIKTCILGVLLNEFVMTECNDFVIPNKSAAGFVVYSNVPQALSSSPGNKEETDVSAFIADNTLFDFEIVISAADVKFYINGTLRATHVTHHPDTVWQLVVGASRSDVETFTFIEYLDVWGE